MPAQLHTVEQVMERLRAGRSTAFALIDSRSLRSVKAGRRKLVSEAPLVEFIQNLVRPAQPAQLRSSEPSAGLCKIANLTLSDDHQLAADVLSQCLSK